MTVRNDASRLAESAHVGVSVAVQDSIRWRCHTTLERLTIPKGFRRAQLDELEELARLQSRYGFDRLPVGGVPHNVGEIQAGILRDAGVEPELVEVPGNLLMFGGASCQWQTLLGNGTTTADQVLTYFSNARAAIGVGDSSTAAAGTQNDLQAASNKLRVAMDATYPLHTDGTTSAANTATFKSTFSTAQANYVWAEWAIFNSLTAGRMLNRKVEALGTKTSASTWALTLALSLA